MADIGFTPDGEGGLHCSLCGINAGFTITDVVAHADWHDDQQARVLLSGVTQAMTEWRALCRGFVPESDEAIADWAQTYPGDRWF